MALPPADQFSPRLRHLDLHPVDEGEMKGVALTDPLGITEEPAFIPETLLPIVARFDGRTSLADLQRELAGEGIPDAFVADLVRQLDERLLLHSPTFELERDRRIHAFAGQSLRRASHAGSAGYPAESAACRQALDRIVPLSSGSSGDPPPRGLVAPHIDLLRGAAGYAAAYGALQEREPADLFVIFGTGHQGPAAPVTGLEMDWETPLGVAKTDRAFVRSVHEMIGAPQPTDLFLHRREHSMEFQVLFLQHVMGDRPFEVAAFLTGMLPTGGGRGSDPAGEDYCKRLLDAFRAVAESSGRRVCFVAGADLAHLGPFFGDARAVDGALLERLERDERERLAHLQTGAPGAFHTAVEGGGNPDRICGTTPIYLTAQLAGGRGDLLHYGQAAAPDGHQVVSFCSMVFPG